jgi:hypothetical protein
MHVGDLRKSQIPPHIGHHPRVANLGAITSPKIQLLDFDEVVANHVRDALLFVSLAFFCSLSRSTVRKRVIPHFISNRDTFGVIWIPAPISPSSEAASRTVTCAPARQKAMAAARPPIPAPQSPMLTFFVLFRECQPCSYFFSSYKSRG